MTDQSDLRRRRRRLAARDKRDDPSGRDGPSEQALDEFVEVIGDALERRYPDIHFVARKPGRTPPPGSRYLPLATRSAPDDSQP